MTKAELQMALAEQTGLTRKQVSLVLDALSNVALNTMGKTGATSVTLPGSLRIERRRAGERRTKKAPARIRNGIAGGARTEDEQDLAVVAARRGGPTTPLREFVRNLKRKGALP